MDIWMRQVHRKVKTLQSHQETKQLQLQRLKMTVVKCQSGPRILAKLPLLQ
ncbi:uncharacterized protein DAT39_015828, partial [Clarias magur]